MVRSSQGVNDRHRHTYPTKHELLRHQSSQRNRTALVQLPYSSRIAAANNSSGTQQLPQDKNLPPSRSRTAAANNSSYTQQLPQDNDKNLLFSLPPSYTATINTSPFDCHCTLRKEVAAFTPDPSRPSLPLSAPHPSLFVPCPSRPPRPLPLLPPEQRQPRPSL